jgi:hypothetical protein
LNKKNKNVDKIEDVNFNLLVKALISVPSKKKKKVKKSIKQKAK